MPTWANAVRSVTGVMPVMYLPCAGSVQSSAEKQPCTIRRLKADQNAQLNKELMALRSCLAENQFLMRGQCAVIPVQIVDKIVKNSSRVTKLDVWPVAALTSLSQRDKKIPTSRSLAVDRPLLVLPQPDGYIFG